MSRIRALIEWVPRTRLYYGWIVLGTASLGTLASTGSAQVTLAGVQDYILNDTGWDRSTLALAVTIGTWIGGFLTPVFGRLADTKGPRIVMSVTAVLIGICFYQVAGASSIWHFGAAYIVSRGIGAPVLISVVPRTIAVNFFLERRNLALGFVSMARPFYGALNVQFISFLSLIASWRIAYKILGIYSIILSVPLFLILRKTPEELGLLPDGRVIDDSSQGKQKFDVVAQSNPREMSWTAREAVKTHSFWLIAVSQFLTILVLGTMGFQLVPYLTDSGLSLGLAAMVWSISAILDGCSQPVWGLLSDKYTPRSLTFVVVLSAMVATTAFLIMDGAYIGLTLVLIWATVNGGLEVLGGMLLASYYGRDSFGTISGMIGPFQLVGLGLGPTLGTLLYKFTNGYNSLFLFALFAYIIACGLLIIARKPDRQNLVFGNP